jgi:hypothetical protein
MPRLVAIDVVSIEAQVVILDATWQDYPQWREGDHWVAAQAPSLIDPGNPPYPGFAVATQPPAGPSGPVTTAVEVWRNQTPTGLHLVYQSILRVGDHGVRVGNPNPGSGGLTGLDLPRGDYPMQVWVDAHHPARVTRVAFVVIDPAPRSGSG